MGYYFKVIDWIIEFPISRDPPEGGTGWLTIEKGFDGTITFPISRDPPEGGT